ncbi:MAG: DUF5678 domain-containing protein [bacterium]|nr:DUF5678 domain-containing protein [bacterium]
MKFTGEHAGKWVATKGEKVLAMGGALTAVMKKVEERRDKSSIKYDLIPKGYIAG